MCRMTRWSAAALAAGVLVGAASPLHAQTPTQPASGVSAAMDRAIGRARALIDDGEGTEARGILDSLVRVAPAGSNDFAEALYWRATLSERVTEAERDWKRLTIDAPLSPRSSDAMVRLAELEMLRGRPADARSYYERVVREYPSGNARAKSQMGIVKSWVAQKDMPRACVALADASAGGVPEGELRLQAEEMGRRCATVDPKLIAKVAAAGTAPATTAGGAGTAGAGATGAQTAGAAKGAGNNATKSAPKVPADARFSVQLAAYDTRDEADAAVARFAKRGIDARVDGDVKPFRVRVGYYATRADANAALARLKRGGQSGFIAEIAK